MSSRTVESAVASVGVMLFCMTASAIGEPSQPPAHSQVENLVSRERHPKEMELEIISRPFVVDQIYQSMAGPMDNRGVTLLESDPPELLWLTGISMDVVEADGQTSASMEFECHTNLGWPRKPRKGMKRSNRRAFTLTQGQTDVRLPLGFGMPMYSDEILRFNTQVLNLERPEIDLTIRHRARILFVRDKDLSEPMKPLRQTGVFVMASLEDTPAVFNVASPDPELAEASCHPGEVPTGVRAGRFKDKFDRRFTGHWIVTPGRHEYRTLITDRLQISHDTTIHFIGVHVHPFSESLELRDLTTGETVWKSHQQNHSERAGLSWVDHYASDQGIPVYADHQYEMISVYDNPTDRNWDAMATMLIYSLDNDGHSTLSKTSTRPMQSISSDSDTNL